MSGSSRNPDAGGLRPLASWKKMGRKVSAPNMAKPMTKPTALAAENTRLANNPRGMTGSAARRSTTRKSDGQRHPDHGHGDDRRRPPSVGGPAQAGEEHQRRGGQGQEDRAQVVDDVMQPLESARELGGGDEEGHARRWAG